MIFGEKTYLKLSRNSGVFTVEAVIIFWAIFLMVLVAFSHMGWEFQKAHLAQQLHRQLCSQGKRGDESIKTQFTVLGSDDALEVEIRRTWDAVDLSARLFWLRTANDIIERVMEDE